MFDRMCKYLRSICAHFQELAFIVTYSPKLVCNLWALNPSREAGVQMIGRVDAHTLVHNRTDFQTNLCLSCTYTCKTAQIGREAVWSGTITQYILPPPAHTHISSFSSKAKLISDSGLTSRGYLSTCICILGGSLQEEGSVRLYRRK